MPSTSDLQAIRNQIAATHPRLHRLVTAPSFRKTLGELTGDRLSRVPNGYRKDHPAANYLRFKQFIGSREYEATFATSSRFYSELLRVFKAVTPLVRFLNRAMLDAATPAPLLVDELPPRDRRRIASPLRVATPMW
jgi:uncharacterized protein (DUF2461 family)